MAGETHWLLHSDNFFHLRFQAVEKNLDEVLLTDPRNLIAQRFKLIDIVNNISFLLYTEQPRSWIDRQWGPANWMVLCFLHQLQQEVGQITDFPPVQQTCVTKPVLTDSDN